MKFIHVAAAVLSLLSVGRSAPVSSCDSLIQTVEISGREQLLGKWMYVAESTAVPSSNFLTKMFVESMMAEITAADDSDAISVFQSQKMFGRCYTATTKVTLKNSTFYSERPFPASSVLLSTGCSDCLVFYSNYTIVGRTYNGFQVVSRRTKVTAAELEEFTKQVECLNLPAPTVMDPEKGFCHPSQKAEASDLTPYLEVLVPEVSSLIEILNNSTREGAMKTIFQMISRN